MADVRIDYELLNQIAGSLKNLAVDLAAESTWEDHIAVTAGSVWDGGSGRHVETAVNDMIGDWDYARSVMALQAMKAAEKADVIGAGFADWDDGIGSPTTSLDAGSWEKAGGEA